MRERPCGAFQLLDLREDRRTEAFAAFRGGRGLQGADEFLQDATGGEHGGIVLFVANLKGVKIASLHWRAGLRQRPE